MKELNERLKKERMLSFLSTASLILLAAGLFSLFVFWMWRIGVLSVPSFISDMFGKEEPEAPEVIPGDDGKIYDALSGNIPEGWSVFADIPEDELETLLEQTEAPKEYTLKNKIIRTSGGVSDEYSNTIWVSGDSYRIQSYRDGKPFVIIVCDGERVSVTDIDGAEESTRTFPLSETFTMEAQAGMPSVGDYLSDETLENKSVTLVRSPSSNVYLLTGEYTGLGLTVSVYISLEYGLILRSETVSGDETVYTCLTTYLEPSITGYSGTDIFTIG